VNSVSYLLILLTALSNKNVLNVKIIINGTKLKNNVKVVLLFNLTLISVKLGTPTITQQRDVKKIIPVMVSLVTF